MSSVSGLDRTTAGSTSKELSSLKQSLATPWPGETWSWQHSLRALPARQRAGPVPAWPGIRWQPICSPNLSPTTSTTTSTQNPKGQPSQLWPLAAASGLQAQAASPLDPPRKGDRKVKGCRLWTVSPAGLGALRALRAPRALQALQALRLPER